MITAVDSAARCGYIAGRQCHRGTQPCPYFGQKVGDQEPLRTYCKFATVATAALPKVHISDLHTFVSCRRKWEYSSPLRGGWTSKRSNKHLWLGRATHYALSAYYGVPRSERTPDVLMGAFKREAFRSLKGMFKADIPKDFKEFAQLGIKMVDHYAVWAPAHDDFEIVMPEVPLSVPMGTFEYTGQTDGLVRQSDGSLWLLEHKTASRIPAYDAVALGWQGTAYVWAARLDPRISALGKVKGVLYNFLYKSAPTMPKLIYNDTALERRKNMGISPELYLREIKRRGFDPNDYEEILAALETERFFRRYPVIPSEKRLAGFQTELTAVATEMTSNPVIYPPNTLYTCPGCPYMELCLLQNEGDDWRDVVSQEFQQADAYEIEE